MKAIFDVALISRNQSTEMTSAAQKNTAMFSLACAATVMVAKSVYEQQGWSGRLAIPALAMALPMALCVLRAFWPLPYQTIASGSKWLASHKEQPDDVVYEQAAQRLGKATDLEISNTAIRARMNRWMVYMLCVAVPPLALSFALSLTGGTS